MHKQDLDTPFVLVDLDAVELNIRTMQDVADRHGVSLRPHAKTHKMSEIARMQIEAGAAGITVAKLGEAEVMVAAGISDILIAYPIVGLPKIERLAKLLPFARITAAVDSEAGALALAQAGALAGVPVRVRIEVDSGFGRVGVGSAEEALKLARLVANHPWLRLDGLMTFAGQSYDATSREELARTAEREAGTVAAIAARLAAEGLPVLAVSAGSTPSAPYVAGMPGITEIRPGTYVFGDLMQVKLGAHALDRCALTVKTTVVSRPASDRAVIDAGTKVFSSDGEDSPIGTGRGYVPGRPGITLEWMTEEHGMLRLSPEEQGLAIGDTLEFVPNHCCAVVNLADRLAAVRGTRVEHVWEVSARGKVH
jgi:D-serine deaminase-like pyridoxal phosphate-dependent protein